MLSEEDAVALAKAGNQDAFAQLVQTHQNRVYQLALGMLSNPQDAQDAAQEVFLAAWQGLARFRGESAFSTWLYRLTANHCVDCIRRRQRQSRLTGGPSLDDPDSPCAQLAGSGESPEDAALRREAWRALSQGLSSLTEEHRQILALRELGGLSYGEIAALLQLEQGTVKSRIARARLQLRRFLLAEGNFFSAPSSKEQEV